MLHRVHDWTKKSGHVQPFTWLCATTTSRQKAILLLFLKYSTIQRARKVRPRLSLEPNPEDLVPTSKRGSGRILRILAGLEEIRSLVVRLNEG